MEPPSPESISRALDILLKSVGEQGGSLLDDASANSVSPIAQVDHEVAALRLALDAIVDEASKRIVTMNQKRNAMVTFNARLPNELKAWIFVLGVEGMSGTDSLKRSLELGRVCSSWRGVVNDTPHMWTVVDLNSKVMAELSISKSRALLLDVEYSRKKSSGNVQEEEEALTFVGRHLQRWQSLRYHSYDLEPIIQYAQSPLPNLHTLHLRQDSTAFRVTGLRLAQGTPLRHLDLSGMFLLDVGNITLNTLKTFTLSDAALSYDEVPLLFAAFPNLESLSLEEVGPTVEDVYPTSPAHITHAHLTSLRATEVEDTLMCYLLSILHADNLAVLQVSAANALPRLFQSVDGLPAAVIRNSSIDRMSLEWSGLNLTWIVQGGGEEVLRLGFHDVEWDETFTEILNFFPSDPIDIPIDLTLSEHSYDIKAIQLDQLPTLETIHIGRWTESILELEELLKKLAEPQVMPDGSLQWLCPRLFKITIDQFVRADNRISPAFSKLVRYRGECGSLEDWEPPEGYSMENFIPPPSLGQLRIVDEKGMQWSLIGE